MKKIFSLILIFCFAFTAVIFSACKDKKDYLYKVDGIEIQSIEIEQNLLNDFVVEFELENKTKDKKEFDFTLIKLFVDNKEDKEVEALTRKVTLNEKAEKEFEFSLDPESVKNSGLTVGSYVSVYYGDVLLQMVIVTK